MRKLVLILAILFVYLQHQLWFGKNGYFDYKNAQNEITKLKKENKQLQTQNKLFFAQIKDLKEGNDAVEEQAREEYHMIKNNEIFYRLIKEK